MGCELHVLQTASDDLSELTPKQREGLIDRHRVLAAKAPEALQWRGTYRNSSGRAFIKSRHGRHRCFLLGHYRTCHFRLHTVVLNKDDHMDPREPQLEAKLRRPGG
jgi:hypothetical protein